MKSKVLVLAVVFSLLVCSGNLVAKERRGAELEILKKDGGEAKGELIAVKNSSLLLLDSQTGFDVSVEIGDLKVIRIVKKSKALPGAGIGLLAGGAISFAYGYATPCGECGASGCTSNAAIYGAVGAGLGLLTGGIAGAFIGEDKAIQIEGKSDTEIKETLEKLRSQARVTDAQ